MYGLQEHELFARFFSIELMEFDLYGGSYPLKAVHELADKVTSTEDQLSHRRRLFLEMDRKINAWKQAGQQFQRRFQLAKEISLDLLQKTGIQKTSQMEKLIDRKLEAIKQKIPDPHSTDVMCIAMLVVDGLANRCDPILGATRGQF